MSAGHNYIAYRKNLNNINSIFRMALVPENSGSKAPNTPLRANENNTATNPTDKALTPPKLPILKVPNLTSNNINSGNSGNNVNSREASISYGNYDEKSEPKQESQSIYQRVKNVLGGIKNTKIAFQQAGDEARKEYARMFGNVLPRGKTREINARKNALIDVLHIGHNNPFDKTKQTDKEIETNDELKRTQPIFNDKGAVNILNTFKRTARANEPLPPQEPESDNFI